MILQAKLTIANTMWHICGQNAPESLDTGDFAPGIEVISPELN